jgi:hypothetical protein
MKAQKNEETRRYFGVYSNRANSISRKIYGNIWRFEIRSFPISDYEDATLDPVVDAYRRFGGTYCFHPGNVMERTLPSSLR